MDAAELARQFAAQYHRDAVARGLDPWKLYDFAVAEANRRDIDVESTAPGGTLLGNSQAIFRQADQLIIHQNAGSDFLKAFLVAHEIGHSELGDDPETGGIVEINPARTAEASPVGMDRVVDYGRKQRREIQMDLFAREFLLPREFVRKLHLEQKMTAGEISERLGAPFDVVAQQLLDALLLPVVVQEAEERSGDRELNKRQQEAAEHRGKAYLLEAGPGTGKTQTLTARVEGLLKGGVDPRNILLLTFSNKAAAEMAERIGRKNKEAAAAMWIGTFHAFGLDIIRRFHVELGLPNDPRMMDRTEAVELIENEFPRLGLQHYRDLYDPTDDIAAILNAISRAKDEVVDEKNYAELAKSMINRATTEAELVLGQKALEVAKVYEAYERLKKDAGCLDFGDLVCLPVRLIESNADVRSYLESKYKHILVDEYQDVNRSSVRLLTAIRPSGENLWAVGDVKQSIYRFRGASSFNIGRFGENDFEGGERGQLELNYRSVKEIVDMFSTFALGMKVGKGDKSLESHRGASGNNPTLLCVDEEDEQTVVLSERIESMKSAGHRYRDQAVLCTGNQKLSEIGQNLERLGIPVLFLGSLFERPEVRDLFALVGLLADRRATGLVRIACWPDFEMPMADVVKVIEFSRTTDLAPGGWLVESEKIPGLTTQGQTVLQKLKYILRGFDETSQPWDVIVKVMLDRTRIAAGIANSERITDRTRGIAIWQLMNFLRVQPQEQGLPIKRTLDRVRRLLRLGDDRDLRQLPTAAQGIDAVRLMTIHGSKGLEFPVVHLPGFNNSSIPRSPQPSACPPPDGMVQCGGCERSLELLRIGHEEEQECLFYVAMSRAKDRFFAYAPTKKSNGHNWPLSPYLEKLSSTISQCKVAGSKQLPPSAEETAVNLVCDGGISFRADQIKLYEGCPRRFLYTHVLQIGGRRTATPFMQMHEAVRAVYTTVIEGASLINDANQLEQKLKAAFAEHGLAEHGYADDYKRFALPMLRYFAAIREGHNPEKPTILSLTFENDRILVIPDDVLVNSDGKRMFRRIKTGHRSASHNEDVDSAALLIAAKEVFPDATVELVHLSDQACETLGMSDKKLQNRKEKLDEFLKGVRSGEFPINPSPRVCPGCPAFFVCGPIPKGSFAKKF